MALPLLSWVVMYRFRGRMFLDVLADISVVGEMVSVEYVV